MKIINKFLIIFFLIIFNNVNALENKIILKVNNDIITSLDVLEEINRLKFFNKNLNQLDDEEIYVIAIQSLTKHRIKKNEISELFKNFELQNEDYLNKLIENNYSIKQLDLENMLAEKNYL